MHILHTWTFILLYQHMSIDSNFLMFVFVCVRVHVYACVLEREKNIYYKKGCCKGSLWRYDIH